MPPWSRLRFVVPVRTIHSGPNPRYFGQERGVTYYNLTSDQFTGLGGIVVPGTLRDSLVLLSMLLEQETALQPTEVVTDTGAYTDVMFGIFHLLGFQFSPRLADVGGTRFWRVDPKADYGALDGLARHRAKMPLVVQNWDDLLRLTGSLKLGTVQAAGLIRTLKPTTARPGWPARWKSGAAWSRASTCCPTSTTRLTGAASWCSLTVARAATSSPAPFSTASVANCANATAKARETNSAPSAWWSTSSCSGTRSTWTQS